MAETLLDLPLDEPNESIDSNKSDIPVSPRYEDYLESSEKEEKEDDDINLKKLYEPWTIIDTYFRDANYYMNL